MAKLKKELRHAEELYVDVHEENKKLHTEVEECHRVRDRDREEVERWRRWGRARAEGDRALVEIMNEALAQPPDVALGERDMSDLWNG